MEANSSRDTCEHPLFGTMVNEVWGSAWVFAREFPQLAIYSWAESAVGADGQQANVEISPEVSDWRNTAADFLRTNTSFDILAQLNAIGVFPVTVAFGSEGAEPSVYQEAAYQRFLAHEASICRQVSDAIYRYAVALQESDSYLFEDLTGYGPLVAPITTEADLPRAIEFRGLRLTRCHADGESFLSFGFSAQWDIEHGFNVIYHRDQVLFMGSHDDTDYALSDPAAYLKDWQPSWETSAELEAGKRLALSLDPADPYDG